MTLVIPSGYAQMTAVLRNDGDPEPWAVTWAVDAGDNPANFTEVIGVSIGAFETCWLSSMTAATRLQEVQGRFGLVGGDTVTISVPTTSTGSGGADKLPQNCALLVRKETSTPGRKGKGRMYLPNVLNESTVDNVGVISPAALVGFQEAADDFLEALSNDTLPQPTPMVLLHNDAPGGPHPPSLVNRLVADPVIATQRRRLRR